MSTAARPARSSAAVCRRCLRITVGRITPLHVVDESLVDPANSSRWIEIRGEVDVTEAGLWSTSTD